MFFKKKQVPHTYDRENLRPVIRSSICTGEKVAGFQNVHTGKISEVMRIRTPRDLEEFRTLYNLGEDEISIKY